MKYLLLLLLCLIPLSSHALNDVRFDFVTGTPAVTVDATADCNNEGVARYDFTIGMPTVVIDSTATCTAGGGATPTGEAQTYIKDGGFYIKNGKLYIK